MASVELSRTADRYLQKLPSQTRARVERRLKRLARDPIPSDAKFIQRDNAGPIFRYRIGKDYRALYRVLHDQDLVLVIRIDLRPRVYR